MLTVVKFIFDKCCLAFVVFLPLVQVIEIILKIDKLLSFSEPYKTLLTVTLLIVSVAIISMLCAYLTLLTDLNNSTVITNQQLSNKAVYLLFLEISVLWSYIVMSLLCLFYSTFVTNTWKILAVCIYIMCFCNYSCKICKNFASKYVTTINNITTYATFDTNAFTKQNYDDFTKQITVN